MTRARSIPAPVIPVVGLVLGALLGVVAPTVIAAGLARHRTDWGTWTRRGFRLLALFPIIFVGVQLHHDWGWAWRWWIGMAGLFAVYGAIIESERGAMSPQADGWQVPRFVRVVAPVGVVVAIALPLVALGLG